MKAVDLFCGTGGFSLGAKEAGFDVIAAFDNDPNLTFSHQWNFPDTTLYLKDVATISSNWIGTHIGDNVDLVIGGPPCQGFSTMGFRDVRDPRRTLLKEFFRVVSEIQPAVFVMENVEGLLQGEARSVLDAALAYVSDYKILAPITLDASNFGAATKRRRAFVFGFDPVRCSGIEPDMFDVTLQRKPTVADALSGLQSACALPDDELGFDNRRIRKNAKISEYAKKLLAHDREFSGDKRTKHSDTVTDRFSKVLPGKSDPVGKHYRLKLDGLCPTLRAGTGAEKGSFQSVRPIHPIENRVITVREAARLQGFPDNHRFHPTIWHSFRQIGNSVSPILAERLLSKVYDSICETNSFSVEAA